MSVRRRGLIGVQQHEVIPPLEYPDAYLLVFYGNAGVKKQITNNSYINRYVLDGVEVNPVEYVHSVTPSTTGYHFVYFWTYKSTPLPYNCDPVYLRIPENPAYWHRGFFAFNQIGRIDCLSKNPYSLDPTFVPYSGVTKIYVPIGSNELYSVADGWKKYKDVIEETNNFNYTI